MTVPSRRVRALRLAALLWAAPLWAAPRGAAAPSLKFQELTRNGRRILVLRDCGNFEEDRDAGGRSLCDEWEAHFSGPGEGANRFGAAHSYPGDAAVLDRVLRSGAYAEVWLVSGGGNLQAGVEVGRTLRRYGATVRVPNGLSCVSACTVAFMGGLFRYLDDGATFKVHSASAAQSGLSRHDAALMARGDFEALAAQQQVVGRFLARQLMTHFQNTLLRTGRAPQRDENDDDFQDWAARSVPPLPYDAREAAADRARLAAEGAAAAQDIVMRIEREAMRWAIADLRRELAARPAEFGPRAEPALRMVEVMYDVSIMETASLTRETMVRMGYLTQEVAPQARE